MSTGNRLERAMRLDRFGPAIVRGLVDNLFEQDVTLLQGSAVMALLAGFGFFYTHSPWIAVFAALVVLIGVSRLALARSYRRQHPYFALERWVGRHLAGSWASGMLWGVASLAVYAPDPNVRFLFIVVQTSLVAAAVIRNCAVPLVATGQMLLAMVPLLLALVFRGSLFDLFTALFVLLYIGAMRTIIRSSHQTLLRALQAADENRALARRLTESNRLLQDANHQLEKIATTDALTRLVNRRGFDLRLDEEWQRAAREGRPLSLLMIDVDYFKQFNDQYGHVTGDDCLRLIAGSLLAGASRGGDVVARYGGEEFAVILPGAPAKAAGAVAERIRSLVEQRKLLHASSEYGRVTLSIGIATHQGATPADLSALVASADAALYQAKRLGRNRIEVAGG